MSLSPSYQDSLIGLSESILRFLAGAIVFEDVETQVDGLMATMKEVREREGRCRGFKVEGERQRESELEELTKASTGSKGRVIDLESSSESEDEVEGNEDVSDNGGVRSESMIVEKQGDTKRAKVEEIRGTAE